MMIKMINAPRTADETGIRRKVLEDLTLKTMYLMGELSLHDLAEHLRLSLRIVDEVFQHLRKDQLCQVTGMGGSGAPSPGDVSGRTS